MSDRKRFFLTSDTHFFHTNIITLGSGRPFEDIESHDETIVNNWNATVSQDDVVVHLGDVVMGHRRESLRILARLNGYKVLIPGNHDYVSGLEKPKRRSEWQPEYGAYFDTILADTIQFGNLYLSHYPPAEISDHGEEDRYPHMRPPLVDGAWYLHGHTHQRNTHTELSNGSLAINVGVDANNWTPVPAEYVIDGFEEDWQRFATWVDNGLST